MLLALLLAVVAVVAGVAGVAGVVLGFVLVIGLMFLLLWSRFVVAFFGCLVLWGDIVFCVLEFVVMVFVCRYYRHFLLVLFFFFLICCRYVIVWF